MARHGRGAALIWKPSDESDFERKLRVPAQGGALRERISTAGRHHSSRRDQIFPSTMLGEQPWAKPNTFDTFNTGARLDYDLARKLDAFAEPAAYSHSLIDDNVIYALWVRRSTANGNVNCPDAPDTAYFFCPDGTYEIYDYRSPGELRIDALGRGAHGGPCEDGKNLA
jgi:hypothetical protein